jgi:hypothetical protein
VRFDDRLLTVLNQPASDRHDAAVRWRQLVDLVARAGPNSASPVVAQALESIRAEARGVEEPLRAAAARAIAALPLPLGLLEYFASDKLSVAAPVLAAATLDASQWRALLENADAETRRFVEALHPEVAAPPTDMTDALVEAPPVPTAAEPPAHSSLHEVVARIERRRAMREQRQPVAGTGTASISDEAPALFRWECGPSGEIAWVDGAPRGALVGRSLARAQEIAGDRIDEDVVRAFAMRAPFRDGSLTIGGDGLVAGEWKISAVPAFDPADGRFAGYRGVALRDVPPAAAPQATEILSDPDSLRELVHEIKTPLNAIIGFAEIIDGQFLGPADRRYRERAADIVSQARLLLSAIDDLDFAAKVHSSKGSQPPTVDLGDLVERMVPTLRELADARGVELEAPRGTAKLIIAVDPELADRVIYRMCGAMIEQGESGERLRLSIERVRDRCRVSISRPAAVRGLSDAQLFDLGRLSGSFSLPLVRGLASIAGADLVTSAAGISLLFPAA